MDSIDYCKKIGLNIIFCHLGYKNINEIWVEGEFGEKVTNEYIEDLNIMKEKQIDMVIMHFFDIGHFHCHFNDKFDFEFFKNRFFAVHFHDNDSTYDSHLLPFDGTVDLTWEKSWLKCMKTYNKG